MVSLILQMKDRKSGREVAGGAAWHPVNVGASSENCTASHHRGHLRELGSQVLGSPYRASPEGETQEGVGASQWLSQQSAEQAAGKEPGWPLGGETGEERGWVARHFSGSFAPRCAGQKELPESQCLIAPQISLSRTKWVPWGWEGIGI